MSNSKLIAVMARMDCVSAVGDAEAITAFHLATKILREQCLTWRDVACKAFSVTAVVETPPTKAGHPAAAARAPKSATRPAAAPHSPPARRRKSAFNRRLPFLLTGGLCASIGWAGYLAASNPSLAALEIARQHSSQAIWIVTAFSAFAALFVLFAFDLLEG